MSEEAESPGALSVTRNRPPALEPVQANRASKTVVGDVLFVGLTLVAIFIRYHALNRAGAPPGFDNGDWLGLARGFLGHRVTPKGIAASPIVPLLSYASVRLFGAQLTFVSFGAVFATMPGAGAYLVLRKRIPPIDAALVCALLVACAGAGEAASWGGLPQLLALGLLPVAVLLIDRAFDRAAPNLAVLAGFSLLAIFLVSDFIFAFAALAAGGLVLGRLPTLFDFIPTRRIARLVFLTAAPLVLAVPLALQIVRVRVEAALHPAGTIAGTPSALDRVNIAFGSQRLVWHAVLLGGLAGVALLWERRYEIHWRVAVALAVVGVGLTAVFEEPRIAYLVPTVGVISLALWSPELRRLSRLPLFALLVGAACAIQFHALPATARVQADYYQALTPGTVKAIDWVKAHTDDSALVAVTPYRDGPSIGWWIEGLAGRHTLTASNLRWLHFDSERVTAQQAARIFANGVPTVRSLQNAKAKHVTLVFIDKRWSEFQTGRVASLRREAPTAVVFENQAVVVLSTADIS
jgi:hypothetical protein